MTIYHYFFLFKYAIQSLLYIQINRPIQIPDDGSTILQEVTGGKSLECVQDTERTYRDVELVENKVS